MEMWCCLLGMIVLLQSQQREGATADEKEQGGVFLLLVFLSR